MIEKMLADNGGILPGMVVSSNEARFSEQYFSEPLTTYAVGFRDPNDIQGMLEFVAPVVRVGKRFEFKKADSDQEFLSESDDVRSIGADFKRVEFKGTSVSSRVLNKGLTIRVDLDQVDGQPNWREVTVGRLLRRIFRNEFRRAVTGLSGAGVNTAKTWDTSTPKDPDADLLTALVAGAGKSGIYANRVLFGQTASAKRVLSLRAQNLAGQQASSTLTPQQLADFLGVSEVRISRERYTTAAETKTEIVNNLVIAFFAESGMSTEDASNIKRFVAPCEGGGDVRVYEQQVSAKLVDITVEHNSNIVVTSTLGVQKLTIS
jgi:hypothetical protein